MTIRLAIPSIEEDDLAAVREVLASGFLVQGAKVAAFERAVAGYVGTEHAVAVSNCTAALYLSLLALDIKLGDKVAVASYSWPATANVIALVGAEPVFVDIDRDTFNIDPAALADILHRERIKAVLPVHAFGGMADMPAILEVASQHGVPVVEDAACALGAEMKGKQAGTWGTLGCFSFHPRKAITTGEGGIVTTNDAALARRLRILRNHGQDPDAAAPDFVEPGHNMRLTEFQAALGLTQMVKLDRIIASRRLQASRYDALLASSGIRPPSALPGSRHVYQSYVALVPASAASRRNDIIAAMRQEGIETTIGTYHIPLTRFYRERSHYAPGHFPCTDDIGQRAISLPLFERLSEEEQGQVVNCLKRISA